MIWRWEYSTSSDEKSSKNCKIKNWNQKKNQIHKKLVSGRI